MKQKCAKTIVRCYKRGTQLLHFLLCSGSGDDSPDGVTPETVALRREIGRRHSQHKSYPLRPSAIHFVRRAANPVANDKQLMSGARPGSPHFILDEHTTNEKNKSSRRIVKANGLFPLAHALHPNRYFSRSLCSAKESGAYSSGARASFSVYTCLIEPYVFVTDFQCSRTWACSTQSKSY